MLETKTDCPLTKPMNCRDYYNPKLCAFANKDQQCLKIHKEPKQSPAAKEP